MKRISLLAFLLLVLSAAAWGLGGGGNWSYAGVSATTTTGINIVGAIGLPDSSGISYLWLDIDQLSPITRGYIRAKKLNANGTTAWGPIDVVNNGTGHGTSVFMFEEGLRAAVTASDGKIIAVYSDKNKDPDNTNPSSGTTEIYAERIDPQTGSKLWNKKLVSKVNGLNFDPALMPDNSGGAYVFYVSGNDNNNLFAQHLDSNGNRLWLTDNGLTVCASAQRQHYQIPLVDSSGNGWVIWFENTGSPDGDYIFASKITGEAPSGGKIAVCNIDSNKKLSFYTWLSACPDGTGGFILVWKENRSDVNSIYAQRVDATGATRWDDNGKIIFGNVGPGPVIVKVDGSYAVIATQDDHAKKIAISDGSTHSSWAGADNTGLVLSQSSTDFFPAIYPDGSGGIYSVSLSARNEKDTLKLIQFFIWLQNDLSGAPPSIEVDVYGQHLNALGQKLWDHDAPIRRRPLISFFPSIEKDPADQSFYSAWVDGSRTSYIGPYSTLGAPLFAARIQEVGSPEIIVLTANGANYSNGMAVSNEVAFTGSITATNSSLTRPWATAEVAWNGGAFTGISFITSESSRSQASISFSNTLPDGLNTFRIMAIDDYDNVATIEGSVVASGNLPIIDQIKINGISYRRGDYVNAAPRVSGRIRTPNTSFSAASANMTVAFSKSSLSNTENIINITNIDTTTGTFEHTLLSALPDEGDYVFRINGSDIYNHVGTFEGVLNIGAQQTIIKDVIAYGSSTTLLGASAATTRAAAWVFSPQKESLVFSYQLSRSADIIVNLISTDGRSVYTRLIKSGEAGAGLGVNTFSWDGTSDFSGKVANGIYILRIMSGKTLLYKGAIVVKD